MPTDANTPSEHDTVRMVIGDTEVVGTVVAAHPEVDSYLVEVADDGRVEIVERHRDEFVL